MVYREETQRTKKRIYREKSEYTGRNQNIQGGHRRIVREETGEFT